MDAPTYFGLAARHNHSRCGTSAAIIQSQSKLSPRRAICSQNMCWYWEAGHFKKELGDLVSDKVLGHCDSQRMVPNEFGTLFTAANVEAHLAQIGRRDNVTQ